MPGLPRHLAERQASAYPSGAQEWDNLTLWIGNHFFQDALQESWFDGLILQGRCHPRAIRTMEFADYCDELWGEKLPIPYPPFEDWCKAADGFVDLGD